MDEIAMIYTSYIDQHGEFGRHIALLRYIILTEPVFVLTTYAVCFVEKLQLQMYQWYST